MKWAEATKAPKWQVNMLNRFLTLTSLLLEIDQYVCHPIISLQIELLITILNNLILEVALLSGRISLKRGFTVCVHVAVVSLWYLQCALT